jgi:K+-sensing histidine kinase KdpD
VAGLAPLLLGIVVGALATALGLRQRRRRRHDLERQLLETLMHDLRTPLTSLQLTLGELSHHEGFAPDERDTLHRAIEEAIALRSFLENLRLVDAATLARPEPAEWAAVSLHEQVERLRYRYDLMGRARNVSLEVQVEPVVTRADPRLVELVLSNLVEVSLRLTDTLVMLELRATEGAFELTCRVPGATLPEPLTIDAFARQRQGQDRLSGMLSLAVVASRLACETMGWQFVRATGELFRVSGSRA